MIIVTQRFAGGSASCRVRTGQRLWFCRMACMLSASATSCCVRFCSSALLSGPAARALSISTRASAVRHVRPGCHASTHRPQNTNAHLAHIAQCCASSTAAVLHRGQYSRSDMDASARSKLSLSKRSYSSGVSSCCSRPGVSSLRQEGSGQVSSCSEPSRTLSVARCPAQSRHTTWPHLSSAASRPRTSPKHTRHECTSSSHASRAARPSFACAAPRARAHVRRK